MADQELLARLEQWHDENQHKKIIQEIEGLPEEIRLEYEIQGRLARALNNTGKYSEAIQVLESVREIGEKDDRWWSRMGFAFYQQERYDAAKKCFLKALELNPENQDAKSFLVWMGLKANGTGLDNRWKEEPEAKPRPQPQEGSNGWGERQTEASGPRRSKESDTAQNGWEQKKTPNQGKPQTGGNGNDWEGRGWEGTALLETALFGVLRFPVKEGFFETLPITLGGGSKMVELYIWENLAEPKNWELIKALLDRVPEMYKKAGERIFPETPEIQAITLAYGEKESIVCTLGFSDSSEESGQRVEIRFGQDLEIIP